MNSMLYVGEVMHSRIMPVKHTFQYPIYFYGFDLNELPELSKTIGMFGYNQLRPVAIHDRDYLYPGTDSLKEKVVSVLTGAGLDARPGKTILLTSARYFNYIFNPISFFYCYDIDENLSCIIVQVNNTFKEMHLYLLTDPPNQESTKRMEFDARKQFHVSPFFPRKGQYKFLLTSPGTQIDNTIRYMIDDQLSLVARIHGSAKPLTAKNLRQVILTHPVSASLTMPRILWQAAKLHWQRRLPVYERPVPNSTMTIRPVPATMMDRAGRRMVMKFLEKLPQGEITMTTPDGAKHLFGQQGSKTSLTMEVNEHRFFRRVMVSGDIGFGEAYTEGDWSTKQLPELLTLLAENESVMDDRNIISSAVGRLVNYVCHLKRPNTVKGSDRNIREHYDLSNNFFSTFLDPTMTYSCAIFNKPEDSLEQAQRNKLLTIINKAGITEDDHVLEIGCGWGSFAIEAVKRTGCRVTGVTISREQLELAQQRVIEAGLQNRIDLRLCDYRHLDGQYDKVVSIEMLEAVGHAGLGLFFKACDQALKVGGKAVLQVITIPDRKYNAYRYSSDWIRKHIFPGGHLPSMGAMQKAISKNSTLSLDSYVGFSAHYAETLERWRQTLLNKQEEIMALGFDEQFVRKWEYYFAYCHAGFRAQIIDLLQMVLSKSKSI